LVELTEGPVFQTVTKDLPDVPEGYQFGILESRDRDIASVHNEQKNGQPTKGKKDKLSLINLCFCKARLSKSTGMLAFSETLSLKRTWPKDL
jgi:hypothetical protein